MVVVAGFHLMSRLPLILQGAVEEEGCVAGLLVVLAVVLLEVDPGLLPVQLVLLRLLEQVTGQLLRVDHPNGQKYWLGWIGNFNRF